uniref:Uncharacterized protein n=1 Tax=Prymnesium polylepis TaxID=72548 RepID=A0A7S4HGX9_9EUKA
MLNAHPSMRLAGEVQGAMVPTAQRWEMLGSKVYRSSPPDSDGDASARKAVQPIDLLCDEQSEFKAFTMGTRPLPSDGAQRIVRGFKDIAWTSEALEMLDVLFPCNRKIFNTRANASAQASSKDAAFATPAVPRPVSTDLAVMLPHARAHHERDRLTGHTWRSHWIELGDDGFTTSQFNNLLSWLGEDSCRFTGVIHSNAPGAGSEGGAGGFNNTAGSWRDAANLLSGNCSLQVV